MKVTFVAHEFGIFPSHGGIASYLFQIVRYILANCADHSVDVICEAHGKSDELTAAYPGRFQLHEIDGRGRILRQMQRTREILREIQPDVVEVADYLGLAKLAALDKQLGLGFENTVFVTDHHTASQEIYEWCNEIDVNLSSVDVKRNIMNERDQMHLVDANIAPSQFLARYVENRYELPGPLPVFPYPYNVSLKKQSDVRREGNLFDPHQAKRRFAIVLLSRFEPRKNQARLVREFCRFLRTLQSQGESLEGIELHMAGNSVSMEIGNQDYRRYVHSLVPTDLSEHIHFHDFLKLEEQSHLISIADLAVMPSTFENFPVAMIETVLREIPVMGSKFSGVADYSRRDADMLTFDPFAVGNLADNIHRFYRLNSTARRELLVNQQAELTQLLAPENSVHKRLAFFQSLRPASRVKENHAGCETLFVSGSPDPEQQEHTWIADRLSCGEFTSRYGSHFDSQGEVSLCLLSDQQVPARLQMAMKNHPSHKLGRFAIAFAKDEHYADLLDVLLGGFPIWLPRVTHQELSQLDAGQPLYEALISIAMQRRLVVDPTGAEARNEFRKLYTDYCFCKKNYILDKLALEAA